MIDKIEIRISFWGKAMDFVKGAGKPAPFLYYNRVNCFILSSTNQLYYFISCHLIKYLQLP